MIPSRTYFLLPATFILALPLLAVQRQSPQTPTWETFTEAGDQARQRGYYAEAEKYYREALRRAEERDPRGPRVALSLSSLASLYYARGKYSQAVPLYEQALAVAEPALGAEHPLVAASVNNLAALYYAEGRYAEAETLYERALALAAKTLGPDHPNVATALNNLAEVYRAQGRYAEAEPLYRRASDVWEKALGPNHPNVATALNNLAELFRAQGRYREAELHLRRALSLWGRSLGPDHANIAAALNNLAGLYHSLGWFAQAEPLYRWALARWESTLGPSHPHLAAGLANLARLYRAQGRQAEADALVPAGSSEHDGTQGAALAEVTAPLRELIREEPRLLDLAVDYFAADTAKRPVFEVYLPSLGGSRLLDFLEATYPFCHSQAHALGQALFARNGDLAAALHKCDTRCTSGCMHGVLVDAFSREAEELAAAGARPEQTLESIEEHLVGLCRQPLMSQLHKQGSCAHGAGHALMAVTGHDVEAALAGCGAFEHPALGYFCATGVFMEYFHSDYPQEADARSLHYPCDTYTRFPVACYRYKAFRLLQALEGNRDRVVQECLSAPPRARLGCFHGLGLAHVSTLYRNPRLLPEICLQGTPEHQAMCIEGAIEKLADYDQEKARAACATLTGPNATLCRAAADAQSYRLEKPTMELYLVR